jgi:hypothetical protein
MSIAPWFDAAAEFERALLERDSPLAELHRQAQLDGAARLKAAGSLRAPSPWQGTTSVSGMRQAIIEAEVRALLREYAAQAAAVTDGADSARWAALVDEGLTRSRRGLLVDEVRDSAAGALVLRESWGFRPVVPNAPVIDCACGYAESGVLAKGLCIECGELVVRRWSAEELRLLALVPEYRARVEEILSDTEARQKKQIGVPSDTPISDVASKRARRSGIGSAAAVGPPPPPRSGARSAVRALEAAGRLDGEGLADPGGCRRAPCGQERPGSSRSRRSGIEER